ncbi:hypothetical protein BH09PSE5_BH09PSE5_36930 [soil metagenome]
MNAGMRDWLNGVDPGVHRRIKGLRLVTAYGLAALAGSSFKAAYQLASGASLGAIAGGFALWASVSTKFSTSRASSLERSPFNRPGSMSRRWRRESAG